MSHAPGAPGPPPKAPRTPNVLLLRAFDAPLWRDPLAWWTAVIAVVSFTALLTSEAPRQMPAWLDVPLGTLVMTGLFALLPALIRLRIRRWLWRRRSARRGEPQPAQSSEPVPDETQPSTTTQSEPAAGSTTTAPSSLLPSHGSVDSGTTGHPEPSSTPTVIGPTSWADSDDAKRQLDAFRDLQFPIARAVRAFQRASNPREQYESLLDASEALSLTLGVCAAAWLRHTSARSESMASLRKAFERGVTQGTWQETTLHASKSEGVAEAFPGLQSFSRSPRKQSSLFNDLRDLTRERNLWAHGSAPRSPLETTNRLGELVPLFTRALSKASFLRDVPWLLTASSSYQARERVFDVSSYRVMGDHPEFERQRLLSAVPLADGRLYMQLLGSLIDLTPFVVHRDCETCGHSELFFADRLVDHAVVLKSFARGHVLQDSSVLDDVRSLAG